MVLTGVHCAGGAQSNFRVPRDPTGGPNLARTETLGERCPTSLAQLVPDWKSHYLLLRERQGVPNGTWQWIDLAAGVRIPGTCVTEADQGAGCVGRIW